MGVVGLANTVAIEGQKNNIHCNSIVPTAASRLTEDILPPDLFAQIKPELIAPVVVSYIFTSNTIIEESSYLKNNFSFQSCNDFSEVTLNSYSQLLRLFCLYFILM